MKYLIAGLGNIGPEYEISRHNIGFISLDQLADKYDADFELVRLAYHTQFKYKGRTIHLIKPTTYMNLSGKAVDFWLKNLKIPIENLLVVTDDVALPFGKLRMRAKGTSAGHNGLKNLEEHLGGIHYPRLRIGIGNNFLKGGQIDYVLSRFPPVEFEALPQLLEKVNQMILSFCATGVDRTMNQHND